MNQTTQQSSAGSAKEPPASLDDRVLTRLFAVLAAQYGSRWSSLIQSEDAENVTRKVWGEALAGIDPAKIKKALDMLPERNPNWPPTVGQFLEMCRVGETDLPAFVSLPRPEPDPQKAEKAFAEINKILKA